MSQFKTVCIRTTVVHDTTKTAKNQERHCLVAHLYEVGLNVLTILFIFVIFAFFVVSCTVAVVLHTNHFAKIKAVLFSAYRLYARNDVTIA